jgi:hypothetical protein
MQGKQATHRPGRSVWERVHPGVYNLRNTPRIDYLLISFYQAGGVFVDRAIREVLKDKLEDSKFAEDEMLDLMVNEFERKVTYL